MDELQKAALWYLKKGFNPIPVRSNKKPFIEWAHFQKERITEAQVNEWWQKWPRANIGLICGEISNLMVVDADSLDGFNALQEFLPETTEVPVVRTPKGWHYYFKHRPGLVNKARVLTDCDVRTDGGYAIAPPSVNGKGGYKWIPDLSISKVALPEMPEMLFDVLEQGAAVASRPLKGSAYNNKVPSSSINKIPYIGGDDKSDDNAGKMFREGRRDESLFHIAHCLFKGGCQEHEVKQVIDILARNCDPPFPEKEINAKILSALKRSDRREKALSDEVRDFILSSSGHFLSSDVAKCLHVSSRDEQKNLSKALSRLCNEGLIERFGNKNGCFRRVETEVEILDFVNASGKEFEIDFPMGLSGQFKLYRGNLGIVAGAKSAGKTAFALDTVKRNMNRREIVYITSEMSEDELQLRLDKHQDLKLTDWKFKAIRRGDNFADLVDSSEKIFIIDFLENLQDAWKIGAELKKIHDKLRDGIAIVFLQKKGGEDLARGGQYTLDKARFYVSLDQDKEANANRVKIVDAKAWRTDRNPRGMYRFYKLVNGTNFITTSEWRD